MGPYIRDAMMGWAPIFIRVRALSHSPRPHYSLVTTLRFDHDRHLATTEGWGRGSLRIEYGHRWPQSRQGGLKHYPSKGRLWHRRHYSHYDPGESLLSYNGTTGSHMARTQWLTSRTTSNLDYTVLISAERSSRGWVKRNWTSSAGRCAMR